MSEQPTPTPIPSSAEESVVDAVRADIVNLENQPVDEHVAVFESAHERLRRALDHPDSA